MRLVKTLFVLAVLGAVAAPNAMAFRWEDAARNPPTAVVGQKYFHALPTIGGCKGVKMFIDSGALPPGINLVGNVREDVDGSDWRFEGTPTQAGEWSFWMAMTNLCDGDRSEEPFTIRVTTGLAIAAPAALPTGTVGEPFPATRFTASGGGTQTWSASGLPAGLAMSADGILSGTPTAHTGGATVTFTVSDGGGRSNSRSYQLAIRNPMTIEPVTVPISGLDRELSVVVRAAGGNEQYTWTLEGNVPPGLTIAPAPTDRFAAVISGTPTTAGSFIAVVKATDTEGRWRTQPVAFRIASPIEILTARFATLRTRRLYSLAIKTDGGVGIRRYGRDTFNWKIVRGKLPIGLRLNTRVGKLIGRPRTAGTFRITVEVRDRFGSVDTQNLVLTVRR